MKHYERQPSRCVNKQHKVQRLELIIFFSLDERVSFSAAVSSYIMNYARKILSMKTLDVSET